MNTKLTIDTSEIETVVISLEHKDQKWDKKSKSHVLRAQATLPLIEELLREHDLVCTDLQEIQVNPGPGSFTGLRVGLAIANTLGYLLKIPVNHQNKSVMPQYS